MVKKTKSFKNPDLVYPDMFGHPSDKDYDIILSLIPSSVPKEDLFVYPIKLSDNSIDRENEFFSQYALEQLEEKIIGLVGIYDHNWSSEGIHSRIFKTELVVSDDKKNETGDPYTYIVGFAYTLRGEKNKDLIDYINTGMFREVSIGFKAGETTSLTVDGESVTRTDSITDVFEWSFVAVPAQRKSGVVKHYNQGGGKSMALKDKLLKLKSFEGVSGEEIDSLVAEVEKIDSYAKKVSTLEATVKSLEQDLDAKGKKVKELEEEVAEKEFESALKDILSELTPVNETAEDLAIKVIEEGLEKDDKGNVINAQEVKDTLTEKYSFLFASTEADEKELDGAEKYEEEEKVDEEEYDEPKDDDDQSEKKKSFNRGIDFTKKSTQIKNKQKSAVKRGITFN